MGNSGGVQLDLTDLLETSACTSGAPRRRIEDGSRRRLGSMAGGGAAQGGVLRWSGAMRRGRRVRLRP
jgi:hypothetical protein